MPRFHPTPQEPVRSSWISGRGKDYGREGNSFCLLEEPFQGIFMVLTATRTMQMYANVYMWSTCGHNRTKTSLWQIVHLHAFKFIMHLSPHTARLASQAFSNLPPRAFRLRMLRLKASHGKSKSFHQAGSIPEWPEALCHNSADALPESKVEQESALVKYIYIYISKCNAASNRIVTYKFYAVNVQSSWADPASFRHLGLYQITKGKGNAGASLRMLGSRSSLKSLGQLETFETHFNVV